jgi:hypothetical protein
MPPAAAGVDRIGDVACANIEMTSRVDALGGIIAGCGSDALPEPPIPFSPLTRRAVTRRLVSVFHMPGMALGVAAEAITELLAGDGLFET